MAARFFGHRAVVRRDGRQLRGEVLERRHLLSVDTAPLGFLVDRPLDDVGEIESAAEVDTFALDLAEGQSASVVVLPEDDLAASLLLRGPDDQVLASATDAAGVPLLLQSIAIAASGTHVVEVGSAASTTGSYDVQILSNAAVEIEPLTDVDNGQVPAAESIDAGFLQLAGSGVARAAVDGQIRGNDNIDLFGYVAESIPFSFEDISSTGNVLLDSGDDDFGQISAAQLGSFAFDLYGTTNHSLFANTNGLLSFGNGTSRFSNSDLRAIPQQAAIAVLWDDLDLGFFGDGGEILWELRGTGSDQRLIVQWNEVDYFPFDAFNDAITFQAVLFSDDSSIELNYLDLAQSGAFEKQEGGSATVGIKDVGLQGGRRLLASFNSGPNELVGSQKSIRIHRAGIPLAQDEADLFSFTADAGQSVSLALHAVGGNIQLELLDSSGNTITRGIRTDNVAQSISEYLVPGTIGEQVSLIARVMPQDVSHGDIDYTLLVLRDAVFDSEPNRSFALAQPATTALGAIAPVEFGATVLISEFAGINEQDTLCNCEPPDTHAAVGPNHIVEVVNTAIAIFTKDGTAVLPPTELSDFFQAEIVAGELFDFDPVVAYDDLAERWIVAVLIGPTAGAAETDLLYAVSNNTDPTAGFDEQHRIDFGGISPNLFADFPKVGFNADAHLFTLNMFGFGFEDVNIVAIDKSTVLDRDSRTFSHFISERPNTSFTMAAASMHTASPGDPMWFVEQSDFGGGDLIRVVRMDDVLTDFSMFTDFEIPVTPYDFVPDAVQPDGVFTTNDPRISNADLRDGRLVAAHPVGIDGEATVRWYEFNVAGDEPTLVQEGDINPGPGVHAFFPSIAVNSAGDIGLTFMQSSADEFVSMYVTGQVAGSPAGATATPQLVKAGERMYFGGRGGDYSGVGVDPVSDTFWAANEVVLSGTADLLWSTWIGEFSVSDIPDEDWYAFSANSGNELRIATATPFVDDAISGGPLDPVISLYGPDGNFIAVGDNGLGDGRNALLVLTAAQSGVYGVQVQGQKASTGVYMLQVEGTTATSPPPVVIDSNPDDGVTLGAVPETVQITLSGGVLANSVDAGDLNVGGLPTTNVSVLDGRSLLFTTDPAADVGDGIYAIELTAGAVLDLQGTGNDAFTSQFILDQAGPRVIQTLFNGFALPADRKLNSPNLTFKAFFDEPLFAANSPRRGLVRPGVDDAFVVNVTTGDTLQPQRVSIDLHDNSFTAEFLDLPEGDYILHMVSGEMAFEDAVGNPLDGEPIGTASDGTPSGDGIAGGDYNVMFALDRDSSVVRELVRTGPPGSLIVSSQTTGQLLPAGDVDRILIELPPHTALSAMALPQNADAIITLQPGDGQPVTGIDAGAPVILPHFFTDERGMADISITSDVATAFDLQLFVNTIIEPTSSSQVIPLDDSRVLFREGDAARFAVLGRGAPSNIDEYSIGAESLVSNHVDVALAPIGDADFTTATVEILTSDGTTLLAQATSFPLGVATIGYQLASLGVAVPAGGVRIRVTTTTSGEYALVVTNGIALDLEPNSTGGSIELRQLDAPGGVVGFLSGDGTSLEFVHQFDPQAFVDISSSGTSMSLSDDEQRTVSIPFGNDVFPSGTASLSNNGVLLADVGGFVPFNNATIPFTGFGTALLPFWDDIDSSQGTIYRDIVTIDGIEALIFQWENRAHFPSTGAATFQMQILAEGPTFVRYAYQDVDFGDAAFDFGASATIGVQLDESTAVQFSFAERSVQDGDAISLRRASDEYRLHLQQDELTTISVEPIAPNSPIFPLNDASIRLEVVDASGAIIATGGSNSSDGASVVSFRAPTADNYTIRLVPLAGRGEYLLRVDDQPLPGDFDADGDVDGRDLIASLLGFSFAENADLSDGDADDDGDVDRDDFDLWHANRGLGGLETPSANLVLAQARRRATATAQRSLQTFQEIGRRAPRDVASLHDAALDSWLQSHAWRQ